MSDLHIGRSNVDYDLIGKELLEAYQASDRILLGGDVFDLVLPSDKKRYRAEALHPRLRGRADVVNEAVEMAFEILEPYADFIDMIGIGNHEEAALHRHHYDAVGELVRRLNEKTYTKLINQAGYTAFVEYEVKGSGRKYPPFVIWYHHGSAKTSSAVRSIRTLNEKAVGFEADLYWSGHSHARACSHEQRLQVVRGRLQYRQVRHVVTGSYMVTYADQSQENMVKAGRKSNYAAEAGYLPHGLGGAQVRLTWDRPGFPTVEVIQ
jgi:DNA repair exonuclease SbcCD nuclease subunit